jgi:hypothetical protein
MVKSKIKAIAMGVFLLAFCSFSAWAEVTIGPGDDNGGGGGGGGGPSPTYKIASYGANAFWMVVSLSVTGQDAECAAGHVTGNAKLMSTTNYAYSGDQTFLYSGPDACSLNIWFNRPQGWGNVYVYAEFKINGTSVAYDSAFAGPY